MTSVGHALVLTAVWLSPPALLGVGVLVLTDGIRGLWAPLALGSGAVLAAVLLGAPWSRLSAGAAPNALRLLRQRWPDAGSPLGPAGLATAASALLFVWAQLAAGRELAWVLGWPGPAVVAVTAAALALAAWRPAVGWGLAVLAAVVALVGFLGPLAAVVGTTDAVWPRVWGEVASRPRVAFPTDSAWVGEGRPVHGSAAELTLPIREEQRVTLLGRGRVRVQLWEGGTWSREVRADTDLTLRPGDRLVVPDGFPIRFQAGRAVPGAPASGPDWLDPPGPRPDWRTVVGLGVTLLLGPLGLAPVHAALPGTRAVGERAARAAGALVTLGFVAAALWGLYAAWLTPEVYLGGVAGVEMYLLPASVAALGAGSAPLADLAILGLAAGGVAAALAALRAVPRNLAGRGDGAAWPMLGVVGAGGILAALTPTGPWPVLVAAFGLGASATGPAVVLVCWRERLSARGVAVGTGLGLGLFVALALLGALVLGRLPETAWLRWLAAWPALVAAPANALVTWLLSAAPRPSPRSPLPPGFADLHV